MNCFNGINQVWYSNLLNCDFFRTWHCRNRSRHRPKDDCNYFSGGFFLVSWETQRQRKFVRFYTSNHVSVNNISKKLLLCSSQTELETLTNKDYSTPTEDSWKELHFTLVPQKGGGGGKKTQQVTRMDDVINLLSDLQHSAPPPPKKKK